jgi:hypothetical protein
MTKNRRDRRVQGSISRKAVRATAKAAGLTEPTVDEKDPAFLALQVKQLQTSVSQLIETQGINLGSIYEAFAMVDAHQQVLFRITRHVVETATRERHEPSHLKLTEEMTLDMEGYFRERQEVIDKAGRKLADKAVAFWSRGLSVEDAILRAKLSERNDVPETSEAPEEYEDQFFGGQNVEEHHQQVAEGTQEGG